jgi:hypothetical protein
VSGTWGAPVSSGEAYRRAGGRRRYNAARRRHKQLRRAQVLALTVGVDCSLWGLQSALAERLGVSRSTVCRDFAAIRDAGRGGLLA